MQQKTAIFVIGHSPAIVTETLAACSLHHHPPIKRLILITTGSGAAILEKRLFDQGGWSDFITHYPRYATIHFSTDDIIRCVEEDIRSEDENRAMAEVILSQVRQYTAEDAPPLIASMAGGRKTMGYYMGFAMSLFGRECDRLTHVLVPEVWEKDRTFMFPPPEEAHQINLVDIPFIRLRSHLKPAVSNADIDTLIRSTQSTIDLSTMPRLTLYILPKSLEYLGQTIEFPEREFTFIQFFAQQKLHHCQHPQQPTCGACHDCFLSVDDMDKKKDELLNIRMQFGGLNSPTFSRFEQAWQGKRAAASNLPEPIRRINAAIEQTLGIDQRAEAIKIKNIGKRNHQAYGIMADKSQIRIKRE